MKSIGMSRKVTNLLFPLTTQIRGGGLKRPMLYNIAGLFFRDPKNGHKALLAYIVIEQMRVLLAENQVCLNPPNEARSEENAGTYRINRIAWIKNDSEQIWENPFVSAPYSKEAYARLWESLPELVRNALTHIAGEGINLKS